MLKTIIIFSIVFFYVSLFVELFFYNIPSVVSTKKILNSKYEELEYFSENIQRYLTWSLSKKILVFVLPMVFIYILHLWPAYFLFDISYNKEFALNNISLGYLGVALVILGRLVSHLYLLVIHKIKTKSFEGFVTKNIFKFSRNPGLIGLYISFLGFILMKPSTLVWICYIIYIIHMHFKIKMEEDYLTNKHGEAYRVYLRKTRRYI